jgi:hypothetical protein
MPISNSDIHRFFFSAAVVAVSYLVRQIHVPAAFHPVLEIHRPVLRL